MDERVARIIGNIKSLENLSQFEANAKVRGALDESTVAAIRRRTGELGRLLIGQKTGLDLTKLSPAEEKIVEAVSVYAGMKKREGSNANRTLSQIAEHGLLGAAERSVAKSNPTIGYQALADADHSELTYEQIVIDHPDEFSPRAVWFSRRALGHENATEKPPAKAVTPVQARTELLLRWLGERSAANEGLLPTHTNAEAAAAIGLEDMHRHGRVFGNIQSRIDFACYLAGLPPLGLTAEAPFEMAWQRDDRSWSFPLSDMQSAAQKYVWRTSDFNRILHETERLPGQAHLSWTKELTTDEAKVRDWAFGLESLSSSPSEPNRRNPAWSREELILALDLYLRNREAPPGKDSPEVAELSEFLLRLSRAKSLSDAETYRNANGVYMKMMNFRRFDPDFIEQGKVGLTRGNKLEEGVWAEFSADPSHLATEVARIRALLAPQAADAMPAEDEQSGGAPYWVFVCNPKKWAIDRFLDRRIEIDTWEVRPSDRHRFAPGQLGMVRVGVDRRSKAERDGNPPLESGIYAVCRVESEAFDGSGANDEFWAPGEAREPGWPTIRLRYLRTYLDRPLTIDRLRAAAPTVSPLILSGFQAASFPISATDFRMVLSQLGTNLEEAALPFDPAPAQANELAALEEKYLKASPEVRERVSRTIERGPVGAAVKRANGFRCQLCEALGQNPVGFTKANGEPYVEAHHVMPVSKREVGSLSASNVMTLCANHHREVHFGCVSITPHGSAFHVQIGEKNLTVPRWIKPTAAA